LIQRSKKLLSKKRKSTSSLPNQNKSRRIEELSSPPPPSPRQEQHQYSLQHSSTSPALIETIELFDQQHNQQQLCSGQSPTESYFSLSPTFQLQSPAFSISSPPFQQQSSVGRCNSAIMFQQSPNFNYYSHLSPSGSSGGGPASSPPTYLNYNDDLYGGSSASQIQFSPSIQNESSSEEDNEFEDEEEDQHEEKSGSNEIFPNGKISY
jgi:hypothetical protein